MSKVLVVVVLLICALCSVPVSATNPDPFISTHSITNKYVGDKFTITALTNLAIGNTILISVFPTPLDTNYYGVLCAVDVTKGRNGWNKISFKLDTSTFKPGNYLVTEQWHADYGNDVKDVTPFTLQPKYLHRTDIHRTVLPSISNVSINAANLSPLNSARSVGFLPLTQSGAVI